MGTVVVVESYAKIRDALARLLAQDGFDVIALDGADGALEIAKTAQLHAFLLEVTERSTAAAEGLAEAIRGAQPSVRIVYLASMPWSPVSTPGLVLVKPFDLNELVRELER